VPQQTEGSPENFHPEIAKPSLAVIPDFPEIESPEPEPPPKTEPRLAYMTAPSFLERDLEPPSLDIAAADGFLLVPMLDPLLRRLEEPRTISTSTGFAKATVSPPDAAFSPLQSCAGLRILTPPILPNNIEKDDLGGWHYSHGPAVINRPAVEIALPVTPSTGFRQAESRTVRPGPSAVPILDRAETLNSSGTIASLFLTVLETSPLGREPVFLDRSAQAFPARLPAALSACATLETLSSAASSATWRNHPSYFLLPTSILEGPASPNFLPQPLLSAPECVMPASAEPMGQKLSLPDLPYSPVAWLRTDFAMAPWPDPVPSSVAPALRLFVPQNSAGALELGVNTDCKDVSKMALTPGDRVVFGQPDPTSVAVLALPRAGVEVRALSIGLSTLSVMWESTVSPRQEMPAARFLPVRRGATLPAARMWPQLGPLRPS
jgi:hypothetical protein